MNNVGVVLSIIVGLIPCLSYVRDWYDNQRWKCRTLDSSVDSTLKMLFKLLIKGFAAFILFEVAAWMVYETIDVSASCKKLIDRFIVIIIIVNYFFHYKKKDYYLNNWYFKLKKNLKITRKINKEKLKVKIYNGIISIILVYWVIYVINFKSKLSLEMIWSVLVICFEISIIIFCDEVRKKEFKYATIYLKDGRKLTDIDTTKIVFKGRCFTVKGKERMYKYDINNIDNVEYYNQLKCLKII